MYKTVITSRAKSDLANTITYISKVLLAPQSALNFIGEIEKLVLSLEQMPNRYALVRDERLAKLDCRSFRVKNYLVFYTVDEKNKTVAIIRILYGGRNWQHLIQNKKPST